MGNEARTSSFFRRLLKTPDFEAFVHENGDFMRETPFSEYLSELCAKNNFIPEHVIKAAQIDRTYGHQLFNGIRKPSRDKVIQLAFGFGMSVDEAQRLLCAAGKNPLYPKLTRDAAIIYCLSRGNDIFDAQSLLESLGLTILGGEWRHDE